MSDLLNDLASKSGISLDQAKSGMGALLSALKGGLPAESFSKVSEAIPGSEEMMNEGAEAPKESSGMLGSIAGMAKKLVGGGGAVGGAGAVLSKLSGAGFSMEQVQKFMANVLAFLKSKLPADVMGKITGMLPGAGAGGEK
jgi:hypothetical protein